MKKQKELKDKYFLSFVEEAIFDPKYKDWAGGRMEVYNDEGPYALYEIRFFTLRNNKWTKFVDEYDFKEVKKSTLDRITKEIQDNYYKLD